MKFPRFLLVAASALLVSLPVLAGDTATFQGQITGVVCSACKDHVVTSLAKIKGVKDIEILPTNLPEVRMLMIKADTATLTAEEVNKLLAADHGGSYQVTKLEKKS